MENASNYSRLSKQVDELELVDNFEQPLSDALVAGEHGDTSTVERSVSPSTSVDLQACRNPGLNSPKKVIVKQSKRLPYWLWYLIAKSLGIKLSPDEKPVLATILYILTITSAIGFVFSTSWYSAYSLVSDRHGDDVLDGCVSVLVIALWCALGVYANKLAYRLFGHRKFLAMLRLHSKTVFKLNAAFVVFFLCTAFIVLHNLSSLPYWIGTPCKKVALDRMVCQLRYVCQVVFSVFSLMWNVLVAVVLISVCRTHTIAIRRFILELEQDALTHNTHLNDISKEVADDSDWLNEDFQDEISEEKVPDAHQVGDRNRTEIPATVSPPVRLTNEDILCKYWTIMAQLRVSSLALQRWMISVVSLTVVWATVNLAVWLSHPPKVYEVLNFAVPLLLLPLLCSAYAEVNNEGVQAVKCIRPIQERLLMLQYLQHVPLQLTVFNHAVSYSTIGTAAVGLLLAFVSKILLHEIS
ncbi:uncharacterized protein [Anabrus simplex]|uniref:uncharacterized protein n=1 Tax=Anabrus simplex TaxID=316456 RepID=UPI0035A2D36A